MDKYSPEEIYKIWEKGKPLYEALWHFYNKKESVPKQLQPIPINKDNPIESLLNSVSSGLRGMAEYSALQRELERNLCAKLKKGNLIAIGYEPPIKITSHPVIIPSHVLEGNLTINKKDVEISGNGLDFLSVRIVRKSAFNKINKKKLVPNIPIKNKKIGRPSRKKEIIAAYKYLKNRGQIDYSKFLKSHTKIIQETVMELFPDVEGAKGMEHEAIRRAIGDLFKADALTSKSASKL